MVDMYKRGMSYRSIAKELQVGPTTVGRLLKTYSEEVESLNIRVGRPPKKAQKPQLCQKGLATYRMTPEEVAAAYGKPGAYKAQMKVNAWIDHRGYGYYEA